MGPGSEVEAFDAETIIPRGSFDEGRWFNLEKNEGEVELKELGTIEQLTAERFAAKKRRAEQSKDRRQRSSHDEGRSGYRTQQDYRGNPPIWESKPEQKSNKRVWVPKDEKVDAQPRPDGRYLFYDEHGFYEPPHWYKPEIYMNQAAYGYRPVQHPDFHAWQPA